MAAARRRGGDRPRARRAISPLDSGIPDRPTERPIRIKIESTASRRDSIRYARRIIPAASVLTPIRCSQCAIQLPLRTAIWQSASVNSGCGPTIERCERSELASPLVLSGQVGRTIPSSGERKGMQCPRCKKEFASAELRPPAGLLRLLALPVQIVWPVGSEIHASYCRRCRRRMNFTLFFVCLFVASGVWLYLFAPRAAPKGTPKNSTNAATKR